jgi:hypothetical protein
MAVEGYSNEDWIAGGITDEASYTPTQLFTAEDEIKTSAGKYKTNQNIAVLTILAKDSTGDLVPWDPTNTDAVVGGATSQTEAAPEAYPVGVAAADMNTTSGGYNADTYGPYYVSACFNPALLVWPAGLASASYELKMAALEKWGAPFRIKRLL